MDITIKGYEISRKLGQGGMAEVYCARHLRLEREVALKVLLPKYSNDPEFADRFLREARIAASLNHPNIVQIYDVDTSGGQLYLAMELISGGDLGQLLTQKPEKDFVLKVFRQLCAALDYAHQKGYIHRDIKPANILFREDESLALSDFGIARAMHSNTNMTSTGLVIGTPSYMSPEQAQCYTLDGRADLYSAAVIAYQFVSGQLPYEADSSISLAIKHINEPIPILPSSLAPMQSFFNTALAKKPADRFATGKAFVDAFAEALNKVKALDYATDTTRVLVKANNDSNTVVRNEETIANTLHNPSSSNAPVATVVNDSPNSFFAAGQNSIIKIAKPVSIAIAVGFLLIFGFTQLSTKPPQLSPGEQARIAQYLIAADSAMAADKLVMPDGDNAFEYFQAVLALSPEDPVAVSGLEQVQNILVRLVEEALQNDELAEADNFITQLQIVAPNSETLRSLSQQISQAKERRLQLISKTLSDLRQFVDASEFDNAITAAAKATSLPLSDDQKDQFNLAIDTLVANNIEVAQQAASSDRFEAAYAALKQARTAAEILSGSEAIARIDRLNADTAARENRQARERRTQELIRAGNSALANGNLVVPPEQNAWYFFSQALQRDPNNQQALAGQQQVKQSLISTIESTINNGNVDNAQTIIDNLIQVDRQHPELSRLQRALKVKQRDLQRQRSINIKIEELYTRAQRYLDANRADGADKIWQDIARLDPNSPGLNSLSAKVADGYVAMAQREFDAGDWGDVIVWVERGLKHMPNHQKLIEMRTLAEAKMQR